MVSSNCRGGCPSRDRVSMKGLGYFRGFEDVQWSDA